MTLKHMKIFVAVCRENSMTKAAEKLYLSQPAVSLAIRELEEYYGVQFFERMSRKLYITEAGKKVFEYAAHIVNLFEEMETKLKNWDSLGVLRIGSSMTIGTQLLPNLIKQFQVKCPHIESAITVRVSDIIEKMLLVNELDIGLIEGVVHFDNLVCEKFLKDELSVICSLENPLCRKKVITLDDLKTQKLILRENNSGTRELIDSVFMIHNFSAAPSWISSSTQAIVNAVANDLGVSIIPARLLNSYQNSGRVCQLKIKGVEFKRYFSIVHHKNKYLSPACEVFLELCRSYEKNEKKESEV